MPTAVQDKWLHQTFGIDVAVAGARTSITQSVDADGNEVLDVGGPAPPAPSPAPAPHGGSPHKPQAGGPAKPAAAPAGKVPRPADPDFKPVIGKVPGPKNHVMCSVHHYVVDTDTKMVIANSVDEYKKTHPQHGGGHGGAPAAPATGKVPRPADEDFKPVIGKVPGPKKHVMCSVHHYVVDTDTKMVIANSVDEYKKTHPSQGHGGHAAGGAPPPAGGHGGPQGGQHDAGHGHGAGHDAGHGAWHGGTHAAGGKPPKAGPQGPAAGPASDVEFEDDGIGKSHKGQFETKVIAAAQHAMTLARINTQKFVLEVEGACRDFADFGGKKAADLNGQITAGDILSSVCTTLMGKVGGKLAEMVTNPVGQKVAGLITGKLTESLSAAAKESGEGAVDRKGMLAALKALPDAARASASAILDGVEHSIKPLADGIIQAVNSGKELTNEQNDFIMPFYDGQTATGDKALEGYGVPNVASGKAIRSEVLTGMIKEFEKQWIKANATLSEKIAMTKDDLDKKAQAAAEAEAKQYGGGAAPKEDEDEKP